MCFGEGERDLLAEGLVLAGLLAVSLSPLLSLSPAPLVLSARASEGEDLAGCALPDGGGLGLSICVGL